MTCDHLRQWLPKDGFPGDSIKLPCAEPGCPASVGFDVARQLEVPIVLGPALQSVPLKILRPFRMRRFEREIMRERYAGRSQRYRWREI